MQTKKDPITVDAFHYDRASPDVEPQQNIQVSLVTISEEDPYLQEADLSAGNIYQIVTPFQVAPEKSGFAVSGQISQVVQLLDFFGEPNEIDQKDMMKLSRPLIEYIETLTYQVTAVALNRGVQLQFTAQANED
ncbi:DUF1149 family protein [Latilactobacillus curvatus]|uniref:DUF1149 family protein n=1 Tax=Latilactobacillus curvatus TaxID=28038 RepID=UPI001CBD1E55|nr:DUF1149 family protein [Latilactobacillus curvatus]MBZ1504684.1 DUF1149 family protein [Latilactobacillus curvatus]